VRLPGISSSRRVADRLDAVSTQVVANGALVADAVRDRCPELRNNARCAQIPVLFLTAAPEWAMSAFARGGVHRILGKPFDLDELVGVVNELVGSTCLGQSPG